MDMNDVSVNPLKGNSLLEVLKENPRFLDIFPCSACLLCADADVSIIAANQAFYEMADCTPEDARLKYNNQMTALGGLEATEKFSSLIKSQGEMKNDVIELDHKLERGNTVRNLHTAATFLEGTNPATFLCITVNTTEKEHLKQQLLQYKSFFEVVVKQSGVEIFRYNSVLDSAKIIIASTVFQYVGCTNGMVVENIQQEVKKSGILHPDYENAFFEVFDTTSASKRVFEGRVKAGNSEWIWARFSLISDEWKQEGWDYIGTIEDITREKEATINYMREAQLLQALLSEKAAYAQLDIDEDKILRIGGPMWNIYNEIIGKVKYSDLITEFINKVVHPDDRAHYLELMARQNIIDSVNNGIDKLGCEFRRIVEQNKMMWMKIDLHLFRDPLNKHVYVFAYLNNIDAQKKQELVLMHESAQDYLTGVFNKRVTETTIREYLKHTMPEIINAFIVLDIDNFKGINDVYGHNLGDYALAKVASILKYAFRHTDIIGRFGGDEFIIFVKDIQHEGNLEERLETLYSLLRGESEPSLSVSAGISFACGGDTYEDAFQKADAALYHAKLNGKGRYSFYAVDDDDGKTFTKRDLSESIKHITERINTVPILTTATNEAELEIFLSEQGDMAYLVDPDTYMLYVGNKAFYDRIGKSEQECVGMKCYEVVHQRQSPCPFCSKANWSTDKFYLWKNHNSALEQDFLVKNKLVQWHGRKTMLAISIDISNDKSIVDSLNIRTAESHSLLSGIQHMLSSPNIQTAMENAMENVGCFFQADAARIWLKDNKTGTYICDSMWENGKIAFPIVNRSTQHVTEWLAGRSQQNPVMVENPAAMLSYSYDMYQYMESYGIHNQRWIPLNQEDMDIGFVEIENITSNFQNIAFMESFCIFIVEEQKKWHLLENAAYANTHDGLTGLLNRNSYEQFLQGYNKDAVKSVAVLIANLNDLKNINIQSGYITGNYYICKYAETLSDLFPECKIFRLNGDEFMLIATDVARDYFASRIVELEGRVQSQKIISASCGYAWDDTETSLASLTEQAVQSMKANKKIHYDSLPAASAEERSKILGKTVTDLDNGLYQVYLQPKVFIETGRITGAEALIRYNSNNGLVMPDAFIDTLERNHLIRYIDLFVFKQVCSQLQTWAPILSEEFSIAVNFSRITLVEHDLLSLLENVISEFDIDRRRIQIEITESYGDIGKESLYQAANQIREAGFGISLDDFGSKYTNLTILADLVVDELKIDRSLIQSLVRQRSNQIIFRSVGSMCRELDIKVIAEGVEEREQESLLRELDCQYGQGYLYGKPMPTAEFEKRFLSPKAH